MAIKSKPPLFSRRKSLYNEVRSSVLLLSVRNGFRSLDTKNYRLFWIGQFISRNGTWMQTLAQAWLVFHLTRSPFALGLVTVFQFLPITLLSLLGGVIADKVSKYKLIISMQTLLLIIAMVFGTLVWVNVVHLWHIYLLAAAIGTISAIDSPARQAFVTELVDRENMANAVALNSMMFNSARVLGPAMGGILIAHAGVAFAFYINALSFIAVIISLLLMNTSLFIPPPSTSHTSTSRRLLDGLIYAWQTPAVLAVLIVVAAIGTFGYNFNVILPLLAGFVVRTDATGFGVLSGALGFGSLLGAISTIYVKKVTLRMLLIWSSLFSVFLSLVSLTSIFPLAVTLLIVLGFSSIIFSTSANTLIHLAVPSELRGRVMGLYLLLFSGSTPIGAFLIAILSSRVGVPATLATCGVLCGIGVAAAWKYSSMLSIAL